MEAVVISTSQEEMLFIAKMEISSLTFRGMLALFRLLWNTSSMTRIVLKVPLKKKSRVTDENDGERKEQEEEEENVEDEEEKWNVEEEENEEEDRGEKSLVTFAS